ncbi:MAG: T9SS type A sorting domain-containing protein [Cryomorphaceae bacterium]|nr:T9SS type A sorting domain-containing protein [Cryomorphaceae bacterium]
MKIFYIFLLFPILTHGQWVERNTTSPNILQYVYFLNDSVGYCGNNNIMHQTADGGWTWQPATGDYADFQKACFIDSLNGFAISDSDLFQSSDGGATWINISDSVEITEFYGLEERNGHLIINGGNPNNGYYWYVSPNGGQHWEMRNHHPLYAPKIYHVLDENHFYAIAEDPVIFRNFKFLSSDDGGITWNSRNLNAGVHSFFTSVYFITPDTGFIGRSEDLLDPNSFGEVIYSHDRFQTIQSVGEPITHGIFFIEGSGSTICAGGINGHLFCSPDSGVHWFSQSVNVQGFFESLFAAYFWDENRIAIVGNSGRVLLSDSGIFHALGNVSFKNPGATLAVFPNPANTTQNLVITGMAMYSELQISLVDMHGKKIKELFSGEYTTDEFRMEISLNDLAAGVYFYEVSHGAGVIREKIIVN